MEEIQVVLTDAMRLMEGKRRGDKRSIRDLQKKTGLPALNQNPENDPDLSDRGNRGTHSQLPLRFLERSVQLQPNFNLSQSSG
ncbi:hypothetical protein TCAL_16509 [Tigriopus californicus]|uniref:Uncharacterized protein n=1 Tax=Tigriopus californicus TaxID=6832 RepID=A0A553NV53_TIGCA|nr:hypothetical protein TCAL_16509 [Tigriopus californicus]